MIVFLISVGIVTLFICGIMLAKLIDTLTSSLAPDIATPTTALGQICAALQIQDHDSVWELGCGDARVISYCAQNNPKAEFIGVENGLITNIKARWRTRKQPNTKIIFGDIRSTNFAGATKIYLYLLPEALEVIKPRLPRGCRVVSTEFRFLNKHPSNIKRLKSPSRFAHKLYIYNF